MRLPFFRRVIKGINAETVDFHEFLATPAGLEPATLCLEGRCSIQLSYGADGWKITAKPKEKQGL